MPTFVIENFPVALYDRIQNLAKARQRTPADTLVEVLEVALPPTTPTRCDVPAIESVASADSGTAHGTAKPIRCDPPPPSEPFLTEEICAPFDIPWPEGELVIPIRVAKDIPEPHDLEGLE